MGYSEESKVINRDVICTDKELKQHDGKNPHFILKEKKNDTVNSKPEEVVSFNLSTKKEPEVTDGE